MRTSVLLAFGAGALALAACQQTTKAPFDEGVCYAFEQGKEGEAPKFNVVAENQPQLEFCAARLEEMRQRFLRLGGSRQEIIGSYNGQFLFVDRAGVWTSQSLEGSRFFFMARTGDGRLAIPGAIQQEVEGGFDTPTTPPTS